MGVVLLAVSLHGCHDWGGITATRRWQHRACNAKPAVLPSVEK